MGLRMMYGFLKLVAGKKNVKCELHMHLANCNLWLQRDKM